MRNVLRTLYEGAIEVFHESRRDDVRLLSAAFVYFASLSFVPTLILLVSLAGFSFLGSELYVPLADQVLQIVEVFFGDDFRRGLEESLIDLQQRSLIVSLISLGATLFSASLVFRHISIGFQRIWREQISRGNLKTYEAILRRIIDWLVGFVMLLVVALLVAASVIFYSVVQVLEDLLRNFFLLSDAVWILDPLAAVTLLTMIFALLYKVVPPVSMHWRDVWLGALLCSIALNVLRFAMILYIVFIGARSVYGAVGTFLALMVWIFASGYVLFLGAEVCKIHARRRNA
jgi:membrane protein